MFWQYLIVSFIVSAALLISAVRVIRFFASAPGKCSGCSGCAINDLKKDIMIVQKRTS
ncbi:MAG: FeoB-associated Cys-rich membrane protein [Bacteroidetes bacterium]|nr:FeoB-associated Cys-rich membrane protein [Bacteroidota bacterium]